MAALKEKGLIKRVGSNKSGHWELRGDNERELLLSFKALVL